MSQWMKIAHSMLVVTWVVFSYSFAFGVIPDFIAAGNTSTCAIMNGKAKCWGYGQFDVPLNLKNPRSVSVGQDVDSFICALDDTDTGILCWGSLSSDLITAPEGLKNIKMVSVGSRNACVIEEEGVQCWGSKKSGVNKVPNDLRNPRQVGVGGRFACALDEEGVLCWGDSLSEGTQVPRLAKC